MTSPGCREMWAPTVSFAFSPWEHRWLADIGLRIAVRIVDAFEGDPGDAGALLYSSGEPRPGLLRWYLLPGGRYRVEKAGVGTALLFSEPADGGAHVVTIRPDGNAPPGAIGDMVCREIASLLLWRRGSICLHASSLVAGGRHAIVFLGESGAGKSTTVASLVECGWASLLGDDMAVIDARDGGFHALPDLPVVDLWDTVPDDSPLVSALGRMRPHPLGKTRLEIIAQSGRHGAPVPLGLIYLLVPTERPRDERRPVTFRILSARDAFEALLKSTASLITPEPDELLRHLDTLVALCAQTGVVSVEFSHLGGSRIELRDAIIADAGARMRGPR